MKVYTTPTTYIKLEYSELHSEWRARDLFGKWYKCAYGATIQEALDSFIKVWQPKKFVWL